MARIIRRCFVRYGQGNTRHTYLDHHFHDYYVANGLVCALLYKLDVHNELHNTVRSVRDEEALADIDTEC